MKSSDVPYAVEIAGLSRKFGAKLALNQVSLQAALLIPTLTLVHGKDWILPAAPGVVLLTPLTRIGFCSIALARHRHA